MIPPLSYFNFFYILENCGKFVGPKGISSVIVEKGTPGLSFGKKERKVCLSMSINGWFLNQREVHLFQLKLTLDFFCGTGSLLN